MENRVIRTFSLTQAFNLKIRGEIPITIHFKNATDLNAHLAKLKYQDSAMVIGQNNQLTTIAALKATLSRNEHWRANLCSVGCGLVGVGNPVVGGVCSYVCEVIPEDVGTHPVHNPNGALVASACVVGGAIIVGLLLLGGNARK